MTIKLSEHQNQALDKFKGWYENDNRTKNYYVLAGFAGTGKTSLAIDIQQNTPNCIFAAYTGKAVNVLRDKGCRSVTTIHKMIYEVDYSLLQELRILEQDYVRLLDEGDGNTFQLEVAKKAYEDKKHEAKKMQFIFSNPSMGNVDLLIVDEYSMLDKKIVEDLLKTNLTILFLGDPFQLPPISGECPLVPDDFLTEVHRQALDSGIIQAATAIREGKKLNYGDYGDFIYTTSSQLREEQYIEADQIICGRNATRFRMNNWYREKSGFTGSLPVKGEKVICLKNAEALGLFNGMIVNVTESARKTMPGDVRYVMSIDGLNEIGVWEGDIKGYGDKYDWANTSLRPLNRFDYAYAITCHKSQGSEFDNLIVINEPIGKSTIDRSRWLYTALTRGKKKVILIDNK